MAKTARPWEPRPMTPQGLKRSSPPHPDPNFGLHGFLGFLCLSFLEDMDIFIFILHSHENVVFLRISTYFVVCRDNDIEAYIGMAYSVL